MDCGYVLEEESDIFNHEVFPGCLWATHTALMVAACRDHVAGGAIGWSSYHFSDEVHLPRSNHVANAGDGVEHSSYFFVAESLFANAGDCYLEDASDAAVEEHFKFVELRFA